MSQTVSRAISILQYLAESPRRTSEIARYLDVHDSTASRLLTSLETARFVHRNDDDTFRLGSGIIYLAQKAMESIDLRQIALPHMQNLLRVCKETIHLAVLEDKNVVYMEKVISPQPIRMYSQIGRIAPLHCTGVAKAILAFLDEEERETILDTIDFVAHTGNTITSRNALETELRKIREQGYAVDDEEHETGIHCIAVPIWDGNNKVRASLSIAAVMPRTNQEMLLQYLPALQDTTKKVSQDLGGSISF